MNKATSLRVMQNHQEELRAIAEKHRFDSAHVQELEANAKAHNDHIEAKMLYDKRTRDGELSGAFMGAAMLGAAAAGASHMRSAH